MHGPFLSLVVPAFNEEARLPRTLPVAAAWLAEQDFSWELRVVDDGSTDRTCALVQELAARTPGLVLQREPHRGKGGAVRAGMLASRARWRFLCDADFSMPVSEVGRFLPPYAPAAEVLIGTREGPGAARVGEPWHRHALGRVFNRLVQTLLLPGVEDSQCGFKCFSGAAANVLFALQVEEGFAFDVEILYLARQRRLPLAEIPIVWHHMDASKVSPVRDTRRMLAEVLRIRGRAALGSYG